MLRCNSKNSFRRLVVVEGEQLVGLHSSFFAYSFLLILSVLCPAKDKAWLELPGYTLVEDFMVSVARRNTGNGFLKSVSWVLNFYSVQFSSVVQSCPTLCNPMSVATRPPCPSSTPWVHPSPCPLSRWCHPTISFSVVPFSSCAQSFPASESFQMSQLFIWGCQSIGVSASTSVLPMNTQGWSPLEWTGWISLQSKGLSRVFSNTTVQRHQFFSAQLSL